MPASTLDALASVLPGLARRASPWTLEGRTDAGVCVPLHEGARGLEVLLIKRAATLRRHARELGFPGGRPDPGDSDLLDTALRETEEELGVSRRRLRVLGPLSPVPTATSTFLLHPFVAELLPGADAVPNPAEVAALIRMNVEDFFAGRVGFREIRHGGWSSPIFDFDAGSMYGASAHILEELLAACAAATGRELPEPEPASDIPWQ